MLGIKSHSAGAHKRLTDNRSQGMLFGGGKTQYFFMLMYFSEDLPALFIYSLKIDIYNEIHNNSFDNKSRKN